MPREQLNELSAVRGVRAVVRHLTPRGWKPARRSSLAVDLLCRKKSRTSSLPENQGDVLIALTGRAIGAEARLVPTPNPRRFNEIVVGVIGRALEVSPVELCGAVFTADASVAAKASVEPCYP